MSEQQNRGSIEQEIENRGFVGYTWKQLKAMRPRIERMIGDYQAKQIQATTEYFGKAFREATPQQNPYKEIFDAISRLNAKIEGIGSKSAKTEEQG